MDKQLYDAAERGDIVEAVNRLLDEGADTEYRDLVSEVVIIYLFIYFLLVEWSTLCINYDVVWFC